MREDSSWCLSISLTLHTPDNDNDLVILMVIRMVVTMVVESSMIIAMPIVYDRAP